MSSIRATPHRRPAVSICLLTVAACLWATVSPTPAQTGLEGWYRLPDGDPVAILRGPGTDLLMYEPGAGAVHALGRMDDRRYRWTPGEDRPTRTIAVGREASASPSEDPDAPDLVRLERLEAPPYGIRELAFEHDGVDLAGVAFLPEAPASVPGVVLVHGSGSSDRSNAAYLRIADHLARHDIAALVPDKRGAGRSGGDWRQVGFRRLAGDTVAAARRLASLPGVEDGTVGLLSISQGGWVAPLAAEADPQIDFVVSVSGPVVTLAEQQRHYLEGLARRQGLGDDAVARLLDLADLAAHYTRTGDGWEQYREALRSAREGDLAPFAAALPDTRDDWNWAWGRRIVDFDPLPVWKRLEAPVLFAFGTADPMVPVQESVRRLRSLPPEDREGLRIEVYEGSGHGIEDPETGQMRAEFLRLLVDWIESRTSRP